jgi:hypothetical protein
MRPVDDRGHPGASRPYRLLTAPRHRLSHPRLARRGRARSRAHGPSDYAAILSIFSLTVAPSPSSPRPWRPHSARLRRAASLPETTTVALAGQRSSQPTPPPSRRHLQTLLRTASATPQAFPVREGPHQRREEFAGCPRLPAHRPTLQGPTNSQMRSPTLRLASRRLSQRTVERRSREVGCQTRPQGPNKLETQGSERSSAGTCLLS